MGDDALDRDARIKLSIGTKQQGNADGLFRTPLGLAFDHHRGLLLVVDSGNHRVQVFSCDGDYDGGSFVSKFREKGDQPGQFQYPFGLAIDHDHDRILITDNGNDRVQSWSLSEQSFLSYIGHEGSADIKVRNTRAIAIDKHHHRIVIADSYNHRLVFLSSINLSLLFSVGGKRGSQPGEFYSPSGIAIDDDRHRIIVSDSFNHRVQVLSSIDGSFLFEFGSLGDQPCQFKHPQGIVHRQSRSNYRRRHSQQSIAIIHSRRPSHLILRLWRRDAMGRCVRRASRSHRLHGRRKSACDWSQSMACRHQVRLASRSSSICTIMDEASSVDDDDDSVGGR